MKGEKNVTLTDQLKEEVKKAAEVLKKGGLILYPTDTIWGIGCDATNKEAVAKVYALKQREDSKAMLVLLDEVGKLANYVDVPDVAYDLLDAADRPLTVIYSNARRMADNLIGADGTVGIRITSELFSRNLCYRFGKPIVSTSANISGTPAPACFSGISETIREGVDYIVDYRQEEKNNPPPSSIIKLGVSGEIEIIRK